MFTPYKTAYQLKWHKMDLIDVGAMLELKKDEILEMKADPESAFNSFVTKLTKTFKFLFQIFSVLL